MPACRLYALAIPAFSRQYLEYRDVDLDTATQAFIDERASILSTYLCFRDGFFVKVALEAIADVASRIPGFGVVVVGTGDDRARFMQEAAGLGVAENVHLAGDLNHDEFMTLLARSDAQLRTPVSDGVSATVLEALSLGPPVVASDNGTRPPSVRTYPAEDPGSLARELLTVFGDLEAATAGVRCPVVEDTATTEVDLLLNTSGSGLRAATR